MSKAIKIRLVPGKSTKLYRPQPDYSDLYALMSKLHINSVNEAIDLEDVSHISDLEFQVLQIQQKLESYKQEESSVNILAYTLEKLSKDIKKRMFTLKTIDTKVDELNDYNAILAESDNHFAKDLTMLTINPSMAPEELLREINTNLASLNSRKNQIEETIKKLADDIAFIDNLKENINSSTTDITSLDVAYKQIGLE